MSLAEMKLSIYLFNIKSLVFDSFQQQIIINLMSNCNEKVVLSSQFPFETNSKVIKEIIEWILFKDFKKTL